MRKIIFILFFPLQMFAHGGEDHSAEKKETSAQSLSSFSSEAYSLLYELLIKYEKIEPGVESTLKLYLSNFQTNEPLDSAEITVVSSDNSLKFKVNRSGNGVFDIKGKFPEKKIYNLVVTINSKLGPDLIQINNIEVGKELNVENATEYKPSFFSSHYVLLTGGLLIGVILTLIFVRRKRINPTTAIIIFISIFLPINISPVAAHEGHNEGSKKSTTGFSTQLLVQKETQFLFNIITQPLVVSDFTPATKISGTVIPASNGMAVVQSPQTGKLTSINVFVGQKVSKGQILATVEQNIDASAQIDFLSQKNQLDAEYIAAKKDYDRLISIQDIVAKKDLDEAEARLKAAEANKKVFENVISNNTGNAKFFSLKSPINGIVGNFTFATGSSINSGETIFTITDISTVFVEARIFNNDINVLKGGKKFIVENRDSSFSSMELRLINLGQQIEPTSQSQLVLFEVKNPDQQLRIGELVNLRVLSSDTKMELFVPNSAITEIDGKPVVFIKDAAEKYSVSYITAGENNGEFTVINTGAEEGERIVINGSYQMKMIYLNQ